MTSPNPSRPTAPVEYKGEPLDAARGPGLGCFWLQMVLLALLIVVTPLSATAWSWPTWATGVLFVVMLVLLLISGQTVIFLLRIVAAGRSEGRRRPLASSTPTVGELEDDVPPDIAAPLPAEEAKPTTTAEPPTTPGDGGPGMRQ